MTEPRPPIALLTDFGLSDAYVGVVKGAILSRFPGAQLVDISHDMQPQAVLQAAVTLETAWRFFPEGTVFLTVVDPGLGTDRKRIVLGHEARYFVGPDNGCLSAAVPAASRGLRSATEDYSVQAVTLPPGARSVLIENSELLGYAPSATFEGRDVFAPTAAYLAEGGSLESVGRRAGSVQSFPVFRAPRRDDGLSGQVIHIDRFGNLITDIRGDDLGSAKEIRLGAHALPLRRTYGEASGAAAVIGSSGFVELMVPGGNAANELQARLGERVVSV